MLRNSRAKTQVEIIRDPILRLNVFERSCYNEANFPRG